MKIVGQY